MSETVLTEIVTTELVAVETVEVEVCAVEVVEVAIQGPPGPQGIPGVGLADAFLVTNRLSELATPQMKIEARTNLELNHIDLGEFL